MRNLLCSIAVVSCLSPGPAADFPIPDFGAKADGTACTAAFARAVDACAVGGGGRVVVPAGTWFTGPVHLKSNVELHLDKGAVLSFSDDPKDYLPAVPSSWEGLECLNYSPLVYAYGCTNVSLTGQGTLRPQMTRWREMMRESNTDIQGARAILYRWGGEDYPLERRDMTKAHSAVMRPQCVQFNRCKNVRMEGVRIEDSPFWTIHLFMSEDVTIRGIEVCAHGFNNDGVDIEMTRNVLIEDSAFDQGDDGFVFKSGRNRDGWRIGRPTENVEIRNCRLKTVSSLVGVGSELSAGVRNVHVHDCIVDRACNLFYVKTNRRRGGYVRDVRVENVRVDTVCQVLAVDADVLYQWQQFPDYERRPTAISGLILKDVVCGKAKTGVNVNGDAAAPVRGIAVENVRIGRLESFASRIAHAEDIELGGLSVESRGKVETPWDAEYDPTVRPQKTIAFLGDSITDARHISCRLNYWNFIAEELDVRPLVFGVNGNQWKDIPAQAEALRKSGERPSVVSVFMGTNDFNAGVPLGDWFEYGEATVNKNGVQTRLRTRRFSEDPGTLCGRINIGLAAVRAACPTAKILLLTPVHRGYAKFGDRNVQPDESHANALGLFIDDYVARIAEAGRIHSVTVVDLFSSSGICPLDATHARDYFNADRRGDDRLDVLHPNTAGHRRIADAILPTVEKMIN